MISATDDRIESLKRRVAHYASASEQMTAQRKDVFARVFAETQGQPPVVRMAKGLAAFLREKELVLFADDVLAGFQQCYDFSIPAELDCWREPSPESIRGRDYLPLEKAKGVSDDDLALMDEGRRAYDIGLISGYLGGHVIAGYDRVLAQGLGDLADAARRRVREAETEARDFAAASLIACAAARDYILRYAARAGELAREADGDNARQLELIADSCEWISVNPPRTFFEAVQLVALTHEIITAEQPSGSLSLGRADQYLMPFYQRDIQAGELTAAEAELIVQALWLKFGALKGGFQNVTLGGIGAAGEYLANDLTYMGLRASAKLKMDQPLVSVRCHPSMPDELWEAVLDLIGEGLGFPALFNDGVAIDAKCAAGVSRPDAVEYGIVGCVELSAPGKEWSQTEAVRLNWAKVLELMLSGGVCTLSGKEMSIRPGRPLAELTTFDEFYDCFKQVFADAIDLAAKTTAIWDAAFGAGRPCPFLSSTMDGCLAAGRDVVAGGATYNMLTMNGCGMADTVDSLMAIKRLVYESESITLAELAGALRDNFEGADRLRAALAGATERFGNDCDETDALMADLADFVHERLRRFGTCRGGGWQMGLYTVGAHAFLGGMTGALPTGRPAGIALANGLSPCQGADTTGPTAVVKSLTKLDHRRLGNGMVLDIKFHPSFFAEPQRRDALRTLIETYFHLGGLEVQFNVISRETLLAAQANPEEYRDLLVRVSGFSAYFADLDKLCQDEIIARTEHGKNSKGM